MQCLPHKTLHRRCSLLPCMHRPQLCKPGSLVCDGAVTGRFVELKDAGLEGDLVTYNTLLKACMRSANLPCARVIMTWIRERGLQVTWQPCVLGSLLTLMRTRLSIADLSSLQRGILCVSLIPSLQTGKNYEVCSQPPVQRA